MYGLNYLLRIIYDALSNPNRANNDSGLGGFVCLFDCSAILMYDKYDMTYYLL